VAREIHARTERLATVRARRMVEAAHDAEASPDRETLLADAVGRLASRMTGGSDA